MAGDLSKALQQQIIADFTAQRELLYNLVKQGLQMAAPNSNVTLAAGLDTDLTAAFNSGLRIEALLIQQIRLLRVVANTPAPTAAPVSPAVIAIQEPATPAPALKTS